MLDGLFKPRFFSKCKSLLKLAKVRLEGAKRKKLAVCKYLKGDIADLLRNNLDYNAYGRTTGLINEKRRLSTYEYIERCNESVSSNLRLMLKKSECPEECRESIASLMYAAARVAEVPELRDLRELFAEKYGCAVEAYVNPEFIEMFTSQPPSKEAKLQLMRDIAQEFSIAWDSKAVEQKLFTPSQSMKSRDDDDGKSKNEAFGKHGKENVVRAEPVKLPENVNGKNSKSRVRRNSAVDAFLNFEVKDSPRSMPENVSENESYYKTPSCYKNMPPPYTKPIRKDETISKDEVKLNVDLRPEPKSVRSRFPRANTGLKNETGNAEKPKMCSETSLPNVADEEGTIGDLLRHYSGKMSPYPPVNIPEGATGRNKMSDPAPRLASAGERRRHVRTGSWQPESSRVNVKLPDYDEVAARLEALRRK